MKYEGEEREAIEKALGNWEYSSKITGRERYAKWWLNTGCKECSMCRYYKKQGTRYYFFNLVKKNVVDKCDLCPLNGGFSDGCCIEWKAINKEVHTFQSMGKLYTQWPSSFDMDKIQNLTIKMCERLKGLLEE